MRRKADANPTKAFFVRMITRDISLEDCILDLIDNSVDGAWRLEGSHPMTLTEGADLSKYTINIELDACRFCITDNCGGMTLDVAADYAFTFGRKGNSHENYSIGVYGIGMKRAIFKIGNEIAISSTYINNTGVMESFRVPIDVEKWVKDDKNGWDFDIESADHLTEPGVEIIIDSLQGETSISFGSPLFKQNLKRTISRDYAIHLHRGLQIRLNGEVISGWQIEMLEGESFAPMRFKYSDVGEGGSVNVEIFAGMAAQPSESLEPSEDNRKDDRFGWYIVCNGRIVLAADKTALSGWGGDDWPHWHPQYAGFIGLVMFTSENAMLLPLTTTKRSVDSASPVFHRAHPQMRDVSKRWISYTNARKHSLEEAKKLEAATKPLSIFEMPIRKTVSVPSLTATNPRENVANIAYAVPVARVRNLAKALGNINMTYRNVGIESFNYTYKDNVSDE